MLKRHKLINKQLLRTKRLELREWNERTILRCTLITIVVVSRLKHRDILAELQWCDSCGNLVRAIDNITVCRLCNIGCVSRCNTGTAQHTSSLN